MSAEQHEETLRDAVFRGTHILAEFTGVDAALLATRASLQPVFTAALKESGATLLDVVGKQFQPYGVTLVALLAESHASVHTYPECGAVFVDVFTCGEHTTPHRVIQELESALKPTNVQVSTHLRGSDVGSPQ